MQPQLGIRKRFIRSLSVATYFVPIVDYCTTLEVLGHFLYPGFCFVYKRSILPCKCV